MWHYSDANSFRPGQRPSAGSTYDLLLGMRSVAVTLLFLDLSDPSKPVNQVPGFIENVNTNCLSVGLAAPLPQLQPRTRFGVEVMAGPGILRFQTTTPSEVNPGSNRLDLLLPRQVESVQRRQFSRAPLSTAVVFSPTLSQVFNPASPGGVGQALDLSAGGIRLVTPMPLKFGDELYVSFDTPDGLSYRGLQGKVVRVHSHEDRHVMGLHFLNLDTETETKLVQSVFRLQLRGLAKR